MDIDQVLINFNAEQIWLLNFCLGFLMFGVALDLKIEDFLYILKNPKSTLLGAISQLVILPLFTYFLILILKPHYSIALGMLLISVCPGGNVSNYAVHLAKGNAALSVMLTSLSTFTSILFTPFIFVLIFQLLPYENIFIDTTFRLNPLEMVLIIFKLMFIPLVLGMFINHIFPKVKKNISQWVKKISMVIFIGFVFAALFSNIENLINHLGKVFWIVLLHNTIALLIGYWLAKTTKLPFKDVKAISIETGIQNSGLALVLIFNFFQGLGGMALIAAWWSIWHLVTSFAVATYWSKKEIS